jgi:hypothetical protein
MNQLTEVWMKNAELRKKNVKLTEQIAWLKEHNRQLCDQLDHRVRLDRLFPRATSG